MEDDIRDGRPDERILVERASAGDRDAFRELYEQNVAAVHGFIRNRVGADVADDLTAETFCRAFEHIGRFEWRGAPFRAWLFRIAYHQVVGRARRKDTHVILQEDPTPPAVDGHEESVIARLEGEIVVEALERLPEGHRTVLELRYMQDLSVSETAAVLESSEEAVRALTYRALKSLRTAYAELAEVRPTARAAEAQ